MSRRDTYSGSGSVLRTGDNGRLEWISFDPASNPASSVKAKAKQGKRWNNRVPTQQEIAQQSREDDLAEGKLIRSFVSQCATAYAAGKLDATRPDPPKQLKARIKKFGGNVAWLGAQRSHQELFHKAYCRILGRQIPIEQIWAQSTPTSRTK